SGNTAGYPDSAGGIWNAGTLTLASSTISGNTDNNPGAAGGILNTGTLTVSNSTISANANAYPAGLPGTVAVGGIFNASSSDHDAVVVLLNCTIANNTTARQTASQIFSGRGRGTGHAIVNLGNTILSGDRIKPNLFADTDGSFV